MSFDVYFQRFRDGEAEPGGGEQMRQVLEPFIVREEPELDFARLEYGDGSADVYLGGDGMMANRVAGDLPWELLVQGARASGWVIMPVGRPVCLTGGTARAPAGGPRPGCGPGPDGRGAASGDPRLLTSPAGDVGLVRTDVRLAWQVRVSHAADSVASAHGLTMSARATMSTRRRRRRTVRGTPVGEGSGT
ncbi:hypothetical protein [Georgenia sp. SUBG003]|uniref:hypothetical protein n=1 Tax=Georgenia sp. SUBG003 TaxID=1497974 RepID=UPI003AB453BB